MPATTFVSESARKTARGACQTFRHQVGAATKRALSLISSLYDIDVPVDVPAEQADCTKYVSALKSSLSLPLVQILSGERRQFLDLSWNDSLAMAAALNSVPKGWPDSCECMEKSLKEDLKVRLTKEKMALPAGYLDFVDSVVRDIFPRGIRENAIRTHARRVTPPFTSTVEVARKDGGSYTCWEGKREEFLEACLSPVVDLKPEFMVAKDAGKPRPLVKNSSSFLQLRPLHTLLYDTISSKKWLLRGPPSKKRLVSAGFTTRGKYFSADFTAATDSLPIEVAERVLDTLAFLSPPSVCGLLATAKSSLRPSINFGDESVVPTTGQLMGSLLSFPLLCIQNYCAAAWVDERLGVTTPKLINGDDLIVQCNEDWVAEYRRTAPGLGLNLNEKKTAFTRHFLTVNSVYYSSKFRLIPYLRCRGLSQRDPRRIGDAVQGMVQQFEQTRSPRYGYAFRLALASFKPLIVDSRRSMYALGIRAPRRAKIPPGLWFREKRRTGGDVPLPTPPTGMHPALVPLDDEYGVTRGGDIAEAVVDAHWGMGKWEAPEKERLWQVMKLAKECPTRRGKERAATAAARLREKRVKGTVRWVPRSISDCLDLSHNRTEVTEDGFLSFHPCPLCEKVEIAIKKQRECWDEGGGYWVTASALKPKRDWSLVTRPTPDIVYGGW